MATLTIQPSTADCYVDDSDWNANYGSETKIGVGDKFQGILKFDFSALPVGSVISDAELYLYYYDKGFGAVSGRTYWAYRLTQRNWTAAGATWSKYDGVTGWATRGGDFTVTDGASIVMPAGYGWVNWDVTTQTQFAQASTGKVAHFLLKDGTYAADKKAYFYSNNYTTDTAKCPYLIITYTASGWNHNIDKLVPAGTAKINAVASTTGIAKVNGL